MQIRSPRLMPWKQLFITLLLVYLAFCAFLFVMQRRLLYLPSGGGISEQAAAGLGLRHWPSPKDYRGIAPLAELPAPRGTVLVFHGNAGAAYHRGFYIPALARHNLRVILAEYPGYGGRSGRPSEKTLVADALATITLAHQMYGEPVVPVGGVIGRWRRGWCDRRDRYSYCGFGPLYPLGLPAGRRPDPLPLSPRPLAGARSI